MEPRSPPDALTHSTRTGARISGSVSESFAEVLPPPKLVTVRSEPSRFERYSSRPAGEGSGGLVQRFSGTAKGCDPVGPGGRAFKTSLIGHSCRRRDPGGGLCSEGGGNLQSSSIIIAHFRSRRPP